MEYQKKEERERSWKTLSFDCGWQLDDESETEKDRRHGVIQSVCTTSLSGVC